jgi:type IV pilus assembly protein PilM
MASKRFLALDIGASTIKVGEFVTTGPGNLNLVNFGYSVLEGDSSDENRNAAIISGLTKLINERKFKATDAVLSVSGQMVLTRFMKLPATDESKIRQMVQYEAAQNVPFPIDEVVWDFQVVGGKREADLDVVLVAIKSQIVEGIHAAVKEVGLDTLVIDVAPLALYNSVLFNYEITQGCTLVLDVGARTTNLIFIEPGKIFTRSIPIAGNTITQSIAQEFEVSFAEAEDLKLRQGFVGLGGAYEEPELESAARLSKIIRNVMTRLHAEVARSINYYKNQQGGKPPVRLLLSGGTSITPYADYFFKEKMEIEVEYFNPFKNIPIQVSSEDLETVAHSMGEVVGLGLRQVTDCPVEVNLIPTSVTAKQGFAKKVPFFAVSMVCVLLIVLSWWLYYWRWTSLLSGYRDKVAAQVEELTQVNSRLEDAKRGVEKAETQLKQVQEVLKARYFWSEFFEDLNHRIPKIPDQDMWITQLTPENNGAALSHTGIASISTAGGAVRRGRMMQEEEGGEGGEGASAGPKKPEGKKQITSFEITAACRNKGNSLRPVQELLDNLMKEPSYFKKVEVIAQDTPNQADLSFSFKLRAELKKPIPY